MGWIAGAALAISILQGRPAAAVPGPPGERISFADLPGFAADDHLAALKVFLLSCAAGSDRFAPLAAACRIGRALRAPDETTARRFFESSFEPRRLREPAFLTGYFEPVVEGSLVRTAGFEAPLLAAPANLVVLQAEAARSGAVLPGIDPSLHAALRRPDGTLDPLPTRAEIENGALGAAAPPLVWLRDPIDAFFVQVQGSATVRLPGGGLRHLAYAGRNGHPYTSIAKRLVARLGLPPESMDMAGLRRWLRDHGSAPDQPGGALMAENRSFIFFRFDDARPAASGPVGGEGIGLTALRSLAIDAGVWPYGLPVFVDASLPWQGAMPTPFRRLLITQDTGAGIKGAARADIFFGTGSDAAEDAGRIRQSGNLIIFWPTHVDPPVPVVGAAP